MKRTIEDLDSAVPNPSGGLPEDIFLLISRMTPLINVDLLIGNEKEETLLTWRDDGYYPAGWHIPGGVIRFKETLEDRIHACALQELGAGVTFRRRPLEVNECIHPSRRNRGHFISLLFECSLISPPDPKLRYRGGIPNRGEWAWHDACPSNIIPVHEMYRPFIGMAGRGKKRDG
jgi:colanic acid biosynthesis protein WcaH